MMRSNVVWIILVLLLLAVSSSHSSAQADTDLAQKYVHQRNLLTDVPGTAADLGADQNGQANLSRVYELSGTVTGQVTSSGRPIVIITCANNFAVEFSAPQDFLDSSSDWMSAGNVIRVLVRSEISAGPGTSTGVLDLIAAAPESSVSALETQLSALENQIRARIAANNQSRQYPYETSRSEYLPNRSGTGYTQIAGLSDRAAAIYAPYYNLVQRMNPRLNGSDVANITKSILAYSDLYQIDPRLIIAMIIAESGFDPNSVSRTGAVGLGQLMPETAAELGVTDRFDPQQNIAAAVHILSGHVQNYGGAAPCGQIPLNTLLLTMAAYNAGPGAVKKYGGVPPYRETQRYVRKVSQLYRELCGS